MQDVTQNLNICVFSVVLICIDLSPQTPSYPTPPTQCLIIFTATTNSKILAHQDLNLEGAYILLL